MAHNKGIPVESTLNPRADEGAEELERRARHEETGEPRRDVTDAEVGKDRILDRGLGGYGADDEGVAARPATIE